MRLALLFCLFFVVFSLTNAKPKKRGCGRMPRQFRQELRKLRKEYRPRNLVREAMKGTLPADVIQKLELDRPGAIQEWLACRQKMQEKTEARSKARRKQLEARRKARRKQSEARRKARRKQLEARMKRMQARRKARQQRKCRREKTPKKIASGIDRLMTALKEETLSKELVEQLEKLFETKAPSLVKIYFKWKRGKQKDKVKPKENPLVTTTTDAITTTSDVKSTTTDAMTTTTDATTMTSDSMTTTSDSMTTTSDATTTTSDSMTTTSDVMTTTANEATTTSYAKTNSDNQ